MNPDSSRDEVDERFRELIRTEFGDVAGSRAPGEPEPAPIVSPPPRRLFGSRKLPDPIEYFNLSQAIEETPEDYDFEPWSPPVEAASGRPRLRVLAGVALLVAAMLMGALVLAGLRPGVMVNIACLISAGTGLALLFSALPGRNDLDADGAQL